MYLIFTTRTEDDRGKIFYNVFRKIMKTIAI